MGVEFRWDGCLLVCGYSDAESEGRALIAGARIGRALVSVNGVALIGASREATLARLANLSSIPRQLGFGDPIPPELPPTQSSQQDDEAQDEEEPQDEEIISYLPQPRSAHADPFSTPARRRRITYAVATAAVRQYLRQGAVKALRQLIQRDAALKLQMLIRYWLAMVQVRQRKLQRLDTAACIIGLYFRKYQVQRYRYIHNVMRVQSQVRTKFARHQFQSLLQLRAARFLQRIIRKKKQLLQANKIAQIRKVRAEAICRLVLIYSDYNNRSKCQAIFSRWRSTTIAATQLLLRIRGFLAALAARRAEKLLREIANTRLQQNATKIALRIHHRTRRNAFCIWQGALLIRREDALYALERDAAAARAAADAAILYLDKKTAQDAVRAAFLLLDRIAATTTAAAALILLQEIALKKNELLALELQSSDSDDESIQVVEDDALSLPIPQQKDTSVYDQSESIIYLQSWIRGIQIRHRVLILEQTKKQLIYMATKLSASCRAYSARSTLKKARLAAIIIQSAFRCKRARYLFFVAQTAWEAWAFDEVDRQYKKFTDPNFRFPNEDKILFHEQKFKKPPRPPTNNATEEDIERYELVSEAFDLIDAAEAKDLAQKAARITAKHAANTHAQAYKPPASEESLHYGPKPEPPKYNPDDPWKPGKIWRTMSAIDLECPQYVDPPMSKEEADQINTEFPPDSPAAIWFDVVLKMCPPPPNCLATASSKLDFLRRLDRVLPRIQLNWDQVPFPDIPGLPAELFEGPMEKRYPIPEEF
uniref:Uncharacterized protein n=1 Tax=Aureoumbra lagunensis TaxID=44058 RepID=A0A6S8ET13_9STRA